jgi:putative Mg2+ transporter-C (MgtC) family protein
MNTLQTIFEAIASDFTDLDTARAARIGTRLLIAAVFGGMIGLERQLKGKSAGLRTHMLVALGAALFVVILHASESHDAASRAVQGVAAGIGFLGAGAILKDQHEAVKGMTTAADIWLTAAIGVAAGLGQGSTALLATVLALGILAILPRVERWTSPKTPKPSPGPDAAHSPEKPPGG